MKRLSRVIDVKCPKCYAKPGRMCTNKPAHYGGGIFTVATHGERRLEFASARTEQENKNQLHLSEAMDASEITGDVAAIRDRSEGEDA